MQHLCMNLHHGNMQCNIENNKCNIDNTIIPINLLSLQLCELHILHSNIISAYEKLIQNIRFGRVRIDSVLVYK